MRPASGCSTSPSSSPAGDRICLHLCNYRIAPECPAPPCPQTCFGIDPLPGAHLCWPHVIMSLSHVLCLAPDLTRSPPPISVGWTQPWLCAGSTHITGTEKPACRVLLQTSWASQSPCHHPSATCGQRDFRRPQGPVHTDPKLWLPMASGLKPSLVMES